MVTSVQLTPTRFSSLRAAAMEATFTIQRSDQKRVDEVKRIRSALASGGSVLTNAKSSVEELCHFA